MKLCLKILAVAIIAATSYSLIGCAGPASFSYQNISIALSMSCSDCPNGVLYNPAYPVPPYTSSLGSGSGGIAPAGSVVYMANSGEGGTYLITAQVTNAPPNVTWALLPSQDLSDITVLPTGTGTPVGESGNAYGTINSASGNTAYISQNGPPSYGGAALQQALALGIPQGDFMITASVPSNPSNPSQMYTYQQLVQPYNQGNPSVVLIPKTPTNPSGITTSVAMVPRNTNFQFTGYAVGATPCYTLATCNAISPGDPLYTTDNTVVWSVGNATAGPGSATVGGMVNGVPGPYGTITQTGLYTAPSVIPITGYQPIIVLASHLAPTQTNVAYITIQ